MKLILDHLEDFFLCVLEEENKELLVQVELDHLQLGEVTTILYDMYLTHTISCHHYIIIKGELNLNISC
jgi:hypothetical protein